jgi:hypothetical protein
LPISANSVGILLRSIWNCLPSKNTPPTPFRSPDPRKFHDRTGRAGWRFRDHPERSSSSKGSVKRRKAWEPGL